MIEQYGGRLDIINTSSTGGMEIGFMFSHSINFHDLSDDEILACCSVEEQYQQDCTAMTPLIAAIILDRPSLVERMLVKGFDPAVRTSSCSALGTAVCSDKPNADEILQHLLDRLPAFNELDHFRGSPELPEPFLHCAVALGKVNAIKMLLQHGAKPTWRDSYGMDAIEVATEAGWGKLGAC